GIGEGAAAAGDGIPCAPERAVGLAPVVAGESLETGEGGVSACRYAVLLRRLPRDGFRMAVTPKEVGLCVVPPGCLTLGVVHRAPVPDGLGAAGRAVVALHQQDGLRGFRHVRECPG